MQGLWVRIFTQTLSTKESHPSQTHPQTHTSAPSGSILCLTFDEKEINQTSHLH